MRAGTGPIFSRLPGLFDIYNLSRRGAGSSGPSWKAPERNRLLPAGLPDTGNLALVSQFTEADPADAVIPEIRMGPASELAAVVAAAGVFGLGLLLQNHSFFCHSSNTSISYRRGRRAGSAAPWPLRRCSQWCRCRYPYPGSYPPCRTRFRGRSAAPSDQRRSCHGRQRSWG